MAQLQPLLNHVPVVGTYVAILLLAVALLRRSPELTRASLAMFPLLALAGVLVTMTGEPVEEIVEHVAGVSEAIVERHENAVTAASILLGAFGVFSLGGLIAFLERDAGVPRTFAALVLALSLIPAAALTRAAHLGGQIRHPEIRPRQEAAAAETRDRDDGASIHGVETRDRRP